MVTDKKRKLKLPKEEKQRAWSRLFWLKEKSMWFLKKTLFTQSI